MTFANASGSSDYHRAAIAGRSTWQKTVTLVRRV
jgi:hypothetical protein